MIILIYIYDGCVREEKASLIRIKKLIIINIWICNNAISNNICDKKIGKFLSSIYAYSLRIYRIFPICWTSVYFFPTSVVKFLSQATLLIYSTVSTINRLSAHVVKLAWSIFWFIRAVLANQRAAMPSLWLFMRIKVILTMKILFICFVIVSITAYNFITFI